MRTVPCTLEGALPQGSGRSFRRALLLMACAVVVLGCGRTRADAGPTPDADPGVEGRGDDRAESGAESTPRPPRSQERCALVPDAPTLAIGGRTQAASERTSGGSTPAAGASATAPASANAPAAPVDEEDDGATALDPGAVEFARGVADGETFLLGLVKHDVETKALVAVLEPHGARVLDLGRVDAASEPPRVAAKGGHVLALVVDARGGAPSFRVVGITRSALGLETRLGPELKKGKGDANGADVAVQGSGQALVVWDRAPAAGKSEIVGRALDALSLREQGALVVLTPAGQLASEPRLVAANGSYWLLWLVEEAPAASATADVGLLVEPPRVLYARELDGSGRPRGAPVALKRDPAAEVLFDARVLPSGHLLVAHRSSPADRPNDDQPIELSIVDSTGTIRSRVVEAPELAAFGAPTLLGHAGSEASWLALEDTAGTTVLAHISADGSLLKPPWAGLRSRVALAGDPGRLLTAEPRGLGVELGVLRCRTD